MQGQRGTIGSLSETVSMDLGSTSTSAVDQQSFWNNMRNPSESRPAEYVPSPAGTTMTYVNSVSHEHQMSNVWSFGDSSTHGHQNKVTHDERRTQLGWSPLTICAEGGPRLEERQCEPSSSMPVDVANVNHIFMQSSTSNVMSQNGNRNNGFASHEGDSFQVMGYPNLYKSGASENEQIPPPGAAESFPLPLGSIGYLAEGSSSRPGSSFEVGRRACKRKALEANVESSSTGGSSSYTQLAESSVRPAICASNNGCSSLSLTAPSGQVNSGLGFGQRGPTPEGGLDLPVAENAERSRRNFRVRINPPNLQKPIPYALFPTGAAVRHSSISSAQQSSRLELSQSLGSRTAPDVDNASSQSHSVLLHAPVFPQNMLPFQWDRGSNSRTGSSSSSNSARDRDAFPCEETRPRTVGRSISENPMFIAAPDLRNLVRNPANRSLAGGNISIPGNVASSSRVGSGSSSSVHLPSAPTYFPYPTPQYPHRFSELIRRSLISSPSSESAGQSSNQLPLHAGPLTPVEMVLSSRADGQRHHQSYPRHNQSYPRSTSRLERQDGVFGFPHPLRALAAAGEGRNRLVVSEIRNMLDLMRRGEGMRLEDVMLLDRSVLFGVADIHDRYRDMRLDVDNMSYEELLALEERIGNVSTGLSEETIKTRLKQHKYSIPMGSQQEQEPCCICQEEYNNEEDIGTLDCGHDFHTDCIKQWLMGKNLCPICKTTALSTS